MTPTPSTQEEHAKLLEYQKSLQEQQLYQQYHQQQFQLQQQYLQQQASNQQEPQQQHQLNFQPLLDQNNQQPRSNEQQMQMQFFQPQLNDVKLQQKFQEAASYNNTQNSYNPSSQTEQNGCTASPEKITTVIDLEQDGRILTTQDLNDIGNILIYDEVGNRHRIGDIWSEFKTIFVFVRVNTISLLILLC
jgi:hypothetical protein